MTRTRDIWAHRAAKELRTDKLDRLQTHLTDKSQKTRLPIEPIYFPDEMPDQEYIALFTDHRCVLREIFTSGQNEDLLTALQGGLSQITVDATGSALTDLLQGVELAWIKADIVRGAHRTALSEISQDGKITFGEAQSLILSLDASAPVDCIRSVAQHIIDHPAQPLVVQLSAHSRQIEYISLLRALRMQLSHHSDATLECHLSLIGSDLGAISIAATCEMLAAVLGGADYVVIDHRDDAMNPAHYHTLRQTYHLLMEESKLKSVTDPGCGSYQIETMTTKLLSQI